MKEIKISTLMTERDYVRFNFYSLYFKPVGIFITVIGLIMLGLIIKYLTIDNQKIADLPIFQLIFALYILFGMPLATYFLAKKNYIKSKLTKDTIHYQINENSLEIKGKKYDSKIEWEIVYKVEETKNWFLLYMTKKNAHILAKRDFKSEDITTFREIVKKSKVQHKIFK